MINARSAARSRSDRPRRLRPPGPAQRRPSPDDRASGRRLDPPGRPRGPGDDGPQPSARPRRRGATAGSWRSPTPWQRRWLAAAAEHRRPAVRRAAGDDRRGGARRPRDRRADDCPRAARPRRDRTRRRRCSSRSRWPRPSTKACRSSAPRGCAACRSRSATSSASTRRCSSSGACSRRAGCSTIYAIASRRAGPVPGADPRRRRDRGPRDARRRHPVLDRRRAAATRLRRDCQQRIHAEHEDLLFGLLHFPSGTTGMLDVNWLTPAKRRQLRRRRRGGHVRARLPHAAPDVHARQRRRPAAHRRVTPRPSRATSPSCRSRTPSRWRPRSTAFLDVVRDGGRPVVDVEDGLWAVADRQRTARRGGGRAACRALVVSRSACRHDHLDPRRRVCAVDARRLDRDCRPTRVATIRPGRCHAVARSSRARSAESRSSGPGKMGLPLAAQFASHGWQRHGGRRPGGGRRSDQRGSLARHRGAGAGRGGPRCVASGGRPARDDRRRDRGAARATSS